jgi:hypothetical protein
MFGQALVVPVREGFDAGAGYRAGSVEPQGDGRHHAEKLSKPAATFLLEAQRVGNLKQAERTLADTPDIDLVWDIHLAGSSSAGR